MTPTESQAKKIFQQLFGNVDKELGFSLSTKKTKNGILVMKWYSRNSWVDDKLEKKVLLCNGNVYENQKQIGVYNLPLNQ